MSSAIITFIKNPELGKVKTRLAKDIGDQHALEVYKNLMKHTRLTLEKVEQVDRLLFYSENIVVEDEWSEELFKKFLQDPGDLGKRIEAAFSIAFDIGYKKVMIIGSDCPEISADLINEGLSRLEKVDMVVGPALDGGYYLLGLKSAPAQFFEDIPWSTEKVLELTLKKADLEELRVFRLKELSDLDFASDLAKYPFLIKNLSK